MIGAIYSITDHHSLYIIVIT